ncbi:sigma-70 family RNA polymerase sigma factor [Bacillus sp. NSP9.1]|uniref:sigma-70 family RNA polymerase sigma factor n=1 Tax=Bacillus sp. NSP9.1 TaxID=1071078 RepID=UPI00068764CE|nr:sigma-70 family RNA polymerase sigma factor [Bacillus sp. NSP9.1]QHZ45859.1 sigma-70 family RNA polymerase sigma factor [Bacillus sp. NSP9.1]
MKEKLNNLVLNYQQSRSNTSFDEIYEMTITPMRDAFKGVARSLRSSVPEVVALYEDVLMNCIDSYSGEHDFENYFKYSLKNKRANLYRDKKKRLQREVLECVLSSSDDGDEGAATLIVTEEDTPETLLLSKKRADQRQLIDYLVEKSDETTKTIVETFLECERPTPTAIGKKLGVHHMTVIRKLEKLAGYFDSKQFGDHRDYLFAK